MPHAHPKVYRYKRIVSAKLFMDQHYSEPIDLANIAGEAHFSRFHFIRLFKSIYGKTPHQYLSTVRIEAARKLLQAGVSVTDCCYSVGFDSLPSFAALFRRHTGLAPSTFLRVQALRRASVAKTPPQFIPACFAREHGWSQKSNFGEVA